MLSLGNLINLLVAVVISSCLAKQDGCAFPDKNGPRFRFQEVEAHADMGFYAFSFGSSHTYAYQNFVMKLRKPVWLSVTDCYCPGDSFQVFDNGKPVLVTNICPEITPSCEIVNSTNAWSCLESPDFCHGVILLDTGHHNLTIATINSASGGGAAFLRMDTICPQIPGNVYNPINPPPACCMYNPYPNLENYPPTIGRLCNQMVQYPH